MPRSCPPLRSDEVGWHGRRVRTRLRLIIERVFWFVNGGMSQMFVGDDGACVGATDGWPFGEVCVVYGREVLRCAQNDIWGLGSGPPKDGRRAPPACPTNWPIRGTNATYKRRKEGSGITGVWWVSAFDGTMGGGYVANRRGDD